MVSCQVQETDKVSSSQQAHKYLQTDYICFQERKMFLLFAGSPSLGEFLFLNLDIAQFGSNTKTIIKDENSMVMMISDETGEGKMTVHQILPGIMICFTDMHMEQCMSEFELNSGQKVLCIDQCREGRIEMENQLGIFSIMRENELRVDDRKHHKGMAYYPLRHYHGVSIFLEVHAAQKSLDEMFHGFSIDLKPYYDKTQMEKIRAIHEQITSNLQVRVTIEELSKQYDMPATSMKNVFVKFMEIPFILTRRDTV